MKEAIVLLRRSAEELIDHAALHPALNAFAIAKDYTAAAELLEKLSTSKANQVAPAGTPSIQQYAQEDALWTMVRFVGLPERMAKHFIGLLLYVKELEEKASKETTS